MKIKALGAILMILGAGCGSGVSGGPDFTVDILNPVATLNAMMMNTMGLEGPDQSLTLAAIGINTIGQTTGSQLKSLKFYIKEIRICKDLQTNGTAYNSPTGCLSLYKGANTDDYDSYDIATAMADTAAGKYIDLMSKSDLAKIREKPVSAQAGEYNYGLVDWYRPVKVTAEVTMGGETYYTKPGVVTSFTNNGMTGAYTKISNITSGPAGEVTADLGNGGNWFKFQNPLVMTGNDPVKLDLVFNPEGLILASTAASNYPIRDGDNGKAIFIPLLDLAPVAHKASERAMKETYLISPPGNKANIRLELYYIDGDASKTIYGVDVKTLVLDSSAEIMHPQKVSFVATSGDRVSFQNYQKANMVADLARGVDGTLTLDCSTLLFHAGDSICGQASVTAPYVYQGASVVE